MPIKFGDKIRKRREQLGLRVYELAEKVGVNPVYITQIEKHNKLPSPTIVAKISKALLVSHNVIFNDYVAEKFPELNKIWTTENESRTAQEAELEKVLFRFKKLYIRLYKLKFAPTTLKPKAKKLLAPYPNEKEVLDKVIKDYENIVREIYDFFVNRYPKFFPTTSKQFRKKCSSVKNFKLEDLKLFSK
jgi:transcriptional regulator with XRE-family HTH domain